MVIAATLAFPAAAADDFAIQAYFAVPFSDEGAYWGVRASSDQRLFEIGGGDEVAAPAAQVDLRFAEPQRSTLLINGVAIDPVLDRLSADDSAGDGGGDVDSGVDWYQVAGILVGVGLIAAIINADDGEVVACSGPNCTLEPEPPPDPEPADAAEGG
jgi:hypothetical protein